MKSRANARSLLSIGAILPLLPLLLLLLLLSGCDKPVAGSRSTSQPAPLQLREVDFSKVTEKDETWFLNGELFTGVVVRHSEDGKTLLRKWEIKDGKLHGLIEEWWDNGNKMTETHFVDGKRHGENRYWYMDGSPQKLQIYEHGNSVSEKFY